MYIIFLYFTDAYDAQMQGEQWTRYEHMNGGRLPIIDYRLSFIPGFAALDRSTTAYLSSLWRCGLSFNVPGWQRVAIGRIQYPLQSGSIDPIHFNGF